LGKFCDERATRILRQRRLIKELESRVDELEHEQYSPKKVAHPEANEENAELDKLRNEKAQI